MRDNRPLDASVDVSVVERPPRILDADSHQLLLPTLGLESAAWIGGFLQAHADETMTAWSRNAVSALYGVSIVPGSGETVDARLRRCYFLPDERLELSDMCRPTQARGMVRMDVKLLASMTDDAPIPMLRRGLHV